MIHEALKAAADDTSTPALIHGSRTWSYADVWDAAVGAAVSMTERAAPGAVVGIFAERAPEFYAHVYGCWLAGLTYLPLDPANPDRRLASMAADAGAELILFDAPRESRVARVAADAGAATAPLSLQPPAAAVDLTPPADRLVPAYVIFTSGSTGRPKGLAISHDNLAFLVEAQRREGLVPEGSSVAAVAPIGFDAFIWEMLLALGARCPLRILPHDLNTLEGNRRLGVVTMVPSVLASLDPADWSFEAVIAAGERLTPRLAQAWAGRTVLRNAYGPAETTVCATITGPLEPSDEPPPIGRPLPGVTIRIRREDGAILGDGEAGEGELLIGGRGVGLGYLGSGGESAAFTVLDGETFYATGDVVRRDAGGTLLFVGRRDDQVKLLGRRVELGEIEAVVARIEDVRDAAVVPVIVDNETTVLHAFWAGGPDALGADLSERVVDELPAYMVPSVWTKLEELPLNASGKTDRTRLAEMARASDVPNGTLPEHLVVMAEVWERVLEQSITDADANFFALGGHSLLAMRLITAVRDTLGIRVPVRLIFNAPTLAGFTQRALAEAAATPTPDPA